MTKVFPTIAFEAITLPATDADAGASAAAEESAVDLSVPSATVVPYMLNVFTFISPPTTTF
jgi:hypothetical protein